MGASDRDTQGPQGQDESQSKSDEETKKDDESESKIGTGRSNVLYCTLVYCAVK